MKVVPQINMVMNAARCPVNVLFFIIILPCCRKLSSCISKNPLILFRRQADKLLKKISKVTLDQKSLPCWLRQSAKSLFQEFLRPVEADRLQVAGKARLRPVS